MYGGTATFRMLGVSALLLLIIYCIALKFWIKDGSTGDMAEMEMKNGRSYLKCS